MTDEQKAEDYVKINHSHIMSGTMKSIYKKIYLDGLAEGRKEKCLEQNNDGTIRPCEVMKENAELKAQIEKQQHHIEIICNTQKQKMMLLRYIRIKENLEAQIEKMKCCGNCKHNGIDCVWLENHNQKCINLNKWESAE